MLGSFKKSIARLSGTFAPPFDRRGAAAFRPRVESLGDRVVPATVTVAKIQDGTEGGADGLFRFTRTGPTTDPLVIQVGVGGTAAWDDDYTGFSDPTTVTIDSGQSTVDLVVDVENDSVTEFGESVIVTILADAAYTVGSPSSATVMIFDNEGSPVYWIGGSGGSWSNAANWSSGSVPSSTTAVYFSGAYSSYGVTIPSTVTQLGELHFMNGYTGTVTVSNNLSVGRLEMASVATLDQPTPGSGISGTDVTVTAAMLWTAGTINSTTHGATLQFAEGTTGTIDPGNGNAVSIGSTLKLAAAVTTGSTVNLYSGTVNFTGGDGIIIEQLGLFKVSAPPSATVTVTGNGTFANKNLIGVKTGGTCVIESKDKTTPGTYDQSKAMINDGGLVVIEKNVTAKFDGKIGVASNQSVQQNDGTLIIEHGSTLEAKNGIVFYGGKLRTKAIDAAAQPDVTIKGNLSNIAQGTGILATTGATVEICPALLNPTGVNGHQFGTLLVEGAVLWTGGTYTAFVNAAAPGDVESTQADLWKSTLGFTVSGAVGAGNGARIDVSAINVPGGGIRQGREWLVISSNTSISLQQGAVNPPVSTGYALQPENANPVKKWFVKKT